MKLIVHAPNVHQGGGRTLLVALIEALPADLGGALLCDARLEAPPPPAGMAVTRFAPTVAGRWAAERHLGSLAAAGDTVLCMGNLPPLRKLPSRTYLFLQNRNLCEPVSLRALDFRVAWRVRVERYWLRRGVGNVDRVIVQTRAMRECAQRYLGVDAAVLGYAEREVAAGAARAPAAQRKRFLYPAAAEAHKNHARLLEAWRLLRAEGIEAELHLTLAPETALARDIERASSSEGLAIVNHGEVEPSRLRELYGRCDALIFPSTMESFGLPLVEARALGLPIVASELDFVRDVAEPAETFDPASAMSIARAIRRHVGQPEVPAAIVGAGTFVRRVLAGDL